MRYDDYVNGFVERKPGGRYEGQLSVDGVFFPSVVATYFKKDGKNYVWIRRKDVMEYDYDSGTYRTRKAEPRWEAYMEKGVENNTVSYKGTFTFMRMRYSIEGVWDKVMGMDRQRLNLYIERLPMNEQTILKAINERNNRNEQ